MANDLKLTFSTGALSNLPSTFKAGQVLFAIDENNKGYIYFDKNSSTRILMGSDAAYAEKANKDSNGNVIVSTYLTNLQGVKNAAETEYVIQGVRGDGSAPFNTSAVIPITLLSSENKAGTKLYLVGTTSQSSKGIVGYSNSNIYITTGNKLHANLEGKADTAGTADTANAIEWSKITSKPQLVEGFDGSLENNGYKIQLYNTSGSPIPAANTALNGTITIPFAAADSIGLMSTGDQHFSGVKRFDDGINVEDLVPIESHTYTDVIGSANSNAGAGFFYAKVRGKTYNGVWHIKVRVKATVPSNANYETLSYFDLWGTANTYIAYKCQNAIKNTSYRPIYYHSYFRINQNGYNADLGGWLGFNLVYSANPTNTSFKRTVTIDLLMYENCDVEFVSTLLKPADIPNVTVTGNYNSSTTSYDNFNACDNGLRETGDDNDTSTMVSSYNRFTAGEGGLKRYSLAMRDTTGRWQSFTTGTGGNSSTPKSKNTAKFIMGDIVYLSMGSDVASGNIIGTSVVRHYQSLIDYRYSTNAGSATLTANKTVYIVGTVDEDGLFSLDDTWWSQDLPTTEDGKVYIPLGVVYSDSSTYRCDFSGWHTPLIYRNGKIVSYTDTVDISHTTGTLSVPRGGTGQVSFTAGELLMGNGTDAISSVAKASDNTANTVVYRDANGNFSAGIITANLTGTATKALQDNKGQQIDTTYYKDFTVSGTTITLTRGDGDTSKTLNIAALPLAGGIMTGAIKRYYGTASTDPMISMSSNDKDAILFQVGHNTSATPAATNYYKLMYKGSGTSPNNLLQLIAAKNTSNEVIAIKVDENGNVTFTNTVTANISGSATSATKDSANQQITTTYIKDVSVSGTTLTITKGSGSTSTITLQDFDVKVNMKARGTTKAYLLGTVTAPTSTDQAVTSVAETGVYFDTTAAKLVATTFKGALEGNADTATKATKDSANQQINTTYIKDLSISGTTITVTKGDGSTSTLTTQDNNTDTKVNVTLGTTTKAYLLGTSTTPTATAQGVTAIADTGIYLDTTAGQLVATTFKGDLDGNAATATKALKDDKGQQIDVTYYKDFSVSGTTITFTRGDGDTSKTLTIAALPLAGGTMTGAIKRYYGSASTDPMISLAANNQDAILFQVGHGGNSNISTQNYYKLLYKGTSNQPNNYLQLITANTTNSEVVAVQINEQGNVSFTNTVAANISGSAVSATKDSSGQQINTTYIKNISINGTTLTFTKGNGDDTDLTLQDFDVKVNMIARGTTKAYLLGTTTSPTSTNQAVTSVAETGVYFDTTAAKLVATTFKGALEGNADTATKALQDNKGQQIDTTYIKNITIDDTNHKLTFTNGFGGDTNLSLNFVKLTGDTMSGDLVSSSSDTAARGIRVQNSNGSVGVYTATNRGLKDFTKNDWIIYRSTAGTTTYVTNNNYTWTYTSDGKFDAPGDLGENANLIGTASRAVGDQFGHSIVDYIRNISISGQTITVTTGSGAETTLTTQDTNTDTKVNVTLNTTAKAYLLATTTTPTSTAQAVTSIADTGVYLDTAAGALTATTFKGNLAWSYLTSIPQIVEGALGTWGTTGYQIQLYNLAGGAITSSNVATNGVITVPFAANNAAGLISTDEQTLSGIKHIDASGSSIGASKYYQFTTTVGKTHIGWIKFAQLNLNESNHFGAHQFDIFISRTYNSPSPEVYALRVSVSWNRCQIIQLGGDWNGHIITHFRVVKDNTNHKVYFEYYVSENSTANNTGYIRIIQRFGTYTLIPLNEVQTEQDTDFADKWSIELSRDGIVANLIGNASTATYAEKALKDNKGQQIDTTYLQSVTVDVANHKLSTLNGFGSETNQSLDFVKLAGDTMTGSLYISAANTGERFVEAGNSNGKVRLYASTNRGLYDATKSNWIIYRAQAGTTTYIVNNGYTWTYTSDGKFDAPGDLGESANLIGTASRAVGDQFGHTIVDYIHDISISGRTITIKTGGGAETTLTTQDTNTDTQVNVTLGTTTKAYLLGTTTTPTATAQGVTAIADTGVYLDTTAGTLTATTFNGKLAWSNLTDVPQAVEGAVGTKATDKYTIQLYDLAGGAIAANTTAPAKNGVIVIPAASTSDAGLVTTGAQTFAGRKTFNDGITAKSDNDLISHSNEFNFAPALSANMDIHINHRTAGTNTNDAKITKYHFKDGNGQYTVIKASSFEGTVEWSNISSKPQAVEGAVGTKATDKYTIQLYDLAGGAIAANTTTPAKNGVIVIPAASINDAGLVTTGTQTFTGAKTFNTSISTPTLTVTGTGGFNYSGIQNGTTNAARVVWFADASYKGKPVYHTDFTYNPATGELKAGKFTSSGTMSGTALTLSLGNDSLHSTEDATLKVTGGASISDRLSARMVRIDNGVTDTTKGFNLIYNSTEECLEFRFGN